MRPVEFCYKVQENAPRWSILLLQNLLRGEGLACGHLQRSRGSASPLSGLSSSSPSHEPSRLLLHGLLSVGHSAQSDEALGCSTKGQIGCVRSTELPAPRNHRPVEREEQANKPGNVYAPVFTIQNRDRDLSTSYHGSQIPYSLGTIFGSCWLRPGTILEA